MEFFTVSLLNGVSYGLLLFMLSSGLTLIFSMMGVLNFAHASFYMVGAYLAYTFSSVAGYWVALLAAPVLVGLGGALFERHVLRRVHSHGHVPELLVTFGLSFIIVEVVQLVWGTSSVDYQVPAELSGALFHVYGTAFPRYRAFMMAVALVMLVAVWILLSRARSGLIIQAALTHPETAQALGHNVPKILMWVFAGGAALAGLAGVIGGNAFVTEPGMALAMGSVIFVVVVVGGMGSLAGAFVASLLIGIVQTFATGVDVSLAGGASALGVPLDAGGFAGEVWKLKVSQIAPILPYVFLVGVLILRPRGLLGTREG
jgi:branched-chain amino acid transport system permease protein